MRGNLYLHIAQKLLLYIINIGLIFVFVVLPAFGSLLVFLALFKDAVPTTEVIFRRIVTNYRILILSDK
jgi:hypothetical protein